MTVVTKPNCDHIQLTVVAATEKAASMLLKTYQAVS